MKRTFIEARGVHRALAGNGVSAQQIRAMELEIMAGRGDTIAGTGGLKKIRCGAHGAGKRGGVRVVFADYPRQGQTYLMAAFGKADRANLTRAEMVALRALKRQLDKAVEDKK